MALLWLPPSCLAEHGDETHGDADVSEKDEKGGKHKMVLEWFWVILIMVELYFEDVVGRTNYCFWFGSVQTFGSSRGSEMIHTIGIW